METRERIGEGALLDACDPPYRVSRDIDLVRRARREGWLKDPGDMQRVATRIVEIALTTPDEKVAVLAATELRQMVAQDLAEEARGRPELVAHHHTHEIGPATETTIEAKRAKRLARLAGSV